MQNSITPDYRMLLPGENPREYRKHLNGLLDSIRPRDQYEQLAVEEFAAACWLWRRARAVEMQLLFQVGTSYNRGPDGIAEALFYLPDKHFRNFRHFMCDAERRYQQARRAVEQIRRDRERGSEMPAARAAAVGLADPERAFAMPAQAPGEIRNEPDCSSASALGLPETKKRNEANGGASCLRPPETKRSQSAPPPFSLQNRGGPADNVHRSA